MSRYNRHPSVISRNADESIGEDNWLKQFQKKLEKGAVQPKSVDSSLFDQINSIMNSKSKYPSVAAAVEDMRERSGLVAYLNKMSDTESQNKKVASDQNQVIDKKVSMIPVVIQKHPQIKNTLDNYIKDTKGNLPIPAIISKIRSIHQSDVHDAKDWDDEKLILLVSKLNLNAKKNNPGVFENYSNLGIHEDMNDSEIDPSNTDAFNSLNPAKLT
jgi:hypothetical protein